MTPAGAVVLEGVSKTFRSAARSLSVLRGIDLAIAAGECIALVGASGCGKSTLLRALAGLEPIDAGRMTLDGRDIVGPGGDRGLVFQEHRLLPWLTVIDNVAFGLGPRAGRAGRSRAREYVALVGLDGFEGAYPHQLSGGMAQRAAIARALIGLPRVLLLDEPFAALDAFTRIRLQEELLRIRSRERMTVVLVTHDVDEAVFLGDRVAILSNRPASLRRIFEVDLPRPRDRTGDAFGHLRGRVLRALFELRQHPDSDAGERRP